MNGSIVYGNNDREFEPYDGYIDVPFGKALYGNFP